MFIAGKARHRVMLQKPQPAGNDGWGSAEEYVDVLSVPANIMPTNGRERLSADSVAADVDYRVRIRNSPDVAGLNETWRMVWGDRVLDIIAAIDVHARGREWEVLVKEHRERE